MHQTNTLPTWAQHEWKMRRDRGECFLQKATEMAHSLSHFPKLNGPSRANKLEFDQSGLNRAGVNAHFESFLLEK